MKKSVLAILFFAFFGFASSAFAYDTCVAYHPSSNPNPTLPCSYNGYDYDSLAVEAGVNSLFFKGSKYVLTDNETYWSLSSPEYEVQDGILYAWGGWHPEYHELGFSKSGALFFGAGASYGTEPDTLTILIDPPSGGSIAVDEVPCQSCPCQYPISEVNQSDIQATANEGYAFGGWMVTENPHPLSLDPIGVSGSRTITAKFYRTFRNAAAEGFRQSSGYFGECLDYVEYETDLPDDPSTEDICTYSAVNCLGQASMKGYATGNTPRVGAIVIYSQGSGAMSNGHAGIVESINEGAGTMIIHESNWEEEYGYVHNTRSEEINDSKIMGYIYPTP